MATKEQEITQIGHSVTIKGDISGNSDVRVAGTINGSISIEGEIKTTTAVIAGSVKGNIDCSDKLILESSSQYEGNIKTKRLIIQEGAVFQGNCQMNIKPVAAEKPAAPVNPKKEVNALL